MRALKITEVNAVAGGGYYNEDGFYISTNPMEELLSYEAQILANRCNADGVAGPSVNAGISVGLNATNTTTNNNVSGSVTSTTNTNTNCSNQSANISFFGVSISTSTTTCPGSGTPPPTK
jgi:hypothetical protein